MTITITPRETVRNGAPRHRPIRAIRQGAHVSTVAGEVGRRLGLSPKAAQHRLDQAKELLEILPAAARAVDRWEWLRLWSAKYDVCRVACSGIRYSIAALLEGARIDSEEDLARQQLLADPDSLEAKERYQRALAREIAAKIEQHAALTAEIDRDRASRRGGRH